MGGCLLGRAYPSGPSNQTGEGEGWKLDETILQEQGDFAWRVRVRVGEGSVEFLGSENRLRKWVGPGAQGQWVYVKIRREPQASTFPSSMELGRARDLVIQGGGTLSRGRDLGNR